MQASTRRRPDYIAIAAVVALEEQPCRYWGLALIAGCAASWATIFGAAKLLLALV